MPLLQVGSSTSINLRLRVTASHGLLLWAGTATKDYIMIGINKGHVEVHAIFQNLACIIISPNAMFEVPVL